jgi:hypothetical protein
VFVNTIPESFNDGADHFAGARQAGGGNPGAPSVGVTPAGDFRLAWSSGAAAVLVRGGDASIDPPSPLGDGRGAVDPAPLVSVAGDGSAVAAWRARSAVAALEELRENGSFAARGVTAAAAGPVASLRLAGSGIGDGMAGFLQGDQSRAQVEAAIVDAPPQAFAVQVPLRFIRSRRPWLTWDRAENALSGVRYSVAIAGRTVARNLTRTSLRLDARKLHQGRSRVAVTAVDGAGQRRAGIAATLRLDRRAPRVRIARHGRTLSLRVVDGPRRKVAGARRSSVRISFGDGRRARGRARLRHRYRHGGRFRLVVRAADAAGNRVTVRRVVRLP